MTVPAGFGPRPSRRAVLAAGVGGIAGALAGCSGPRAEVGRDAGPTTDAITGFPRRPDAVGVPHLRPDGNRVVDGRGDLPAAAPVDVIPAGIGTPMWVVGVPGERGSRWVVVDGTGRAAGVRVVGGATAPEPVRPEQLPAGQPPVVGVVDGRLRLWGPPPDAARHAVPTVLPGGGSAYVDSAGRLAVRTTGGRTERLAVAALSDARVLRHGEGRVALLTGPTDRYEHGVLGDAIEAERVTTASVGGGAAVVDRTVSVPSPAVIEGLAPIWADLTDSGRPDLIVTASDRAEGARILAYVDGTDTVRRGPPIGGGNRWRHQLAVAPFAPDGVPELAVVRTPHIGGRVEFYRATATGLAIVATLDGYATHVIGSRVLDGGLAADADADGRIELLVPNQARTQLAGVRRTARGATEAWKVPVGGTVASNLAAVRTDRGGVDVALGRADGTVRVWPARTG